MCWKSGTIQENGLCQFTQLLPPIATSKLSCLILSQQRTSNLVGESLALWSSVSGHERSFGEDQEGQLLVLRGVAAVHLVP